LFFVWHQAQLLVSKPMLHALRVNFKNFGHTTKKKIFRLVKLLADLSTRLKSCYAILLFFCDTFR